MWWWDEKVIKIIPVMLFLFCLLEVFEMGLIISGMNKTEELERQISNNLKSLEQIITLLNEYSKGMDLEPPKDKSKIK